MPSAGCFIVVVAKCTFSMLYDMIVVPPLSISSVLIVGVVDCDPYIASSIHWYTFVACDGVSSKSICVMSLYFFPVKTLSWFDRIIFGSIYCSSVSNPSECINLGALLGGTGQSIFVYAPNVDLRIRFARNRCMFSATTFVYPS